jgi:hypothetical protein
MATSGYSTAIFVGPYDLTTDLKSVNVGRSAKELDSTTFQGDSATGDQTFTPGIKKGMFSATGYFNQGTGQTDTTSLDSRLNAILATASQGCAVGWQGTTIGNRGALFAGFESHHDIGSKVADLVGVNLQIATGDGPVDFGMWLANKAARGAGTNVALAGVDFTTTSSAGFAALIVLPSYTGTTISLAAKLQDSTDNITFGDVTGGAFTTLTAAGVQLLTGTASVKRYVRLMYTVTGTGTPLPTFAVIFAKR